MSTYFEVTNDKHDPNYPTLGPTSRQELNTGTTVSYPREAVSFFSLCKWPYAIRLDTSN